MIQQKPSATVQLFNCKEHIIPYLCKLCSFETDYSSLLKDHINWSHSPSPMTTEVYNVNSYICKSCSFETGSILIWIKHKRKCVTMEYNYKWYIIKNQLLNRNEIRKFKCEICNYQAKQNRVLKIHIRRHHFIKEGVQWFYCQYCNFKNIRSQNLKDHIRNKHNNEDKIKWFRCAYCEHKSKKSNDLKKHIQSKHTADDAVEWYKCVYCNYRTKRRSDLTRHIKCKHGIANSGILRSRLLNTIKYSKS